MFACLLWFGSLCFILLLGGVNFAICLLVFIDIMIVESYHRKMRKRQLKNKDNEYSQLF